jgi:GNAT superfamily N-acetyltransferase
MHVVIRPAAANEGERLRAIAVAARGVWGYDIESIRRWGETLDLGPDFPQSRTILVAEVDCEVVGWAGALARGDTWWLDDLWVEPSRMRQRIGRRLFHAIAAHGRAAGFARIEWETERGAVGFYERMGARYVRAGEHKPVMGMELGARE